MYKKIITSVIVSGLMVASVIADSNIKNNEKWYGVMAMDSYPVDGCKIVKMHNKILAYTTSGTQGQLVNEEVSYTKLISNDLIEEKKWLISESKKMGYNAIVGFRTAVYGGFSAYGGEVRNNSIGLGAYVVHTMGNPVKVVCN